MKTRFLMAMVVTLCFGAMALADDERKREMRIVIEGQPGAGGEAFTWVSDDPDLDLQSMQVGETRSIVDASGRSTLITREADGFRFDADGRSIVIPDMMALGFGDHSAAVAMIDGDEIAADIDVEVIADGPAGHHAMPAFVGGADGVTIISGEPLDASTRESIKAVLQSVGRGDDVTFIDGDGREGRRVNIVRKQLEILQ